MPKQTPSQTVGPWFAYGLVPDSYGKRPIAGRELAGEGAQGERIQLRGRVLDGAGAPLHDALIEIWQADAQGRYAHAADTRAGALLEQGFHGFGRCATDAEGRFAFDTVKPGRVPGRGNMLQAPHVNVTVFARGLLSHLYTRIYFADEATANAEDPVLALVEPARRGTILAVRQDGGGVPAYRLDIRLQGEGETVFFAVQGSIRLAPFTRASTAALTTAAGHRRPAQAPPSARARARLGSVPRPSIPPGRSRS